MKNTANNILPTTDLTRHSSKVLEGTRRYLATRNLDREPSGRILADLLVRICVEQARRSKR